MIRTLLVTPGMHHPVYSTIARRPALTGQGQFRPARTGGT